MGTIIFTTVYDVVERDHKGKITKLKWQDQFSGSVLDDLDLRPGHVADVQEYDPDKETEQDDGCTVLESRGFDD